MVDSRRGRHEYLSEHDIADCIERAEQAAAETLAADTTGLNSTALSDRLAAVVDDDQLRERVDDVAGTNGLVVDESAAVAETLERQVSAELDSAPPDDSWTSAAETYITAVQRELVSTDPETETPRLVAIGRRALQDGAFETAETFLDLSREIVHEVDDSTAEALALVALGDGALRRGNVETAAVYYQDGFDIARETGNRSTEATALAGLGNAALQRDELETAEEHHRESLKITREIDDQSTEANSLATLGTIASSRGEYAMAEQYLEESLDIKRLLDDEVGEATVLASLGNVAADRNEHGTAGQRYTEALERFIATDQPREQVQTLQSLATTEQKRGNDAAAIDYCDEGLTLLDTVDLSGLDEADRWFRTTRAQLTGNPDDIDAVYRTALDRIQEDDDPAAFELLGGIWDCREVFEPGTETHGLCLRAGVGFAAYYLLLDTDAVETTHTQISTEISSHRESLSEPARVLFGFVTSGGADRDAEISLNGEDDESNSSEPSTDVLERRTYAAFLSRLTETPSPSELYSQALTAVVNGERSPSEVVQCCLVAWDQRTDEPEDSRAILGSMLLAEAHRECFEFELPTNRQETFDRLADNRSVLSEPMAALFDQLATGSTEIDPDELLAAADRADPSVTDVERMAAAGFLEHFRS